VIEAGGAGLTAEDPDAPLREPPPAPPPPPPSLANGLLVRLTRPHTLRVLIAATTAWSLTVAPGAFARGIPGLARLLALAALGVALAGPLLTPRKFARHVGISAFLALTVACWLIASPAIQPARTDVVRGVLGSLAWGLFALAWNEPWTRPLEQPLSSPHELEARSQLSPGASFIAALGFFTMLTCLFLAWRVQDSGRALLAQAAALAASVGVIAAASVVATSRGARPAESAGRLGPTATRTLLLLVAVALGGALVLVTR
jgi:hypothetical protein